LSACPVEAYQGSVTGRDQRGLLLWLAAAALLFRAALPAGWMPAVAAESGLRLVPCSGWAAPAQAQSAHSGHHGSHGEEVPQPREPQPETVSDQPCAFAASAEAGTGSDAPSTVAPIAYAEPAILAAAYPSTFRALAAPPPPATGPPTV
jgi:hypothetical protein